MAIYVPKIDAAHETRLSAALEQTAEWLLNCGAQELLVAKSRAAD